MSARVDAAGFWRFSWEGWDVAVWRHPGWAQLGPDGRRSHGGVAVQADRASDGAHVMALLDLDRHRDWAAHPELRQAVRDRMACYFPAGFP